jgi:hypothetical protein
MHSITCTMFFFLMLGMASVPHPAHALFGEQKQETPREELAKAIFARPTDATATEAVEVEIGNYRYTIPENYFDSSPKKGCNAEGELFLGTLPEFRAHTVEERKKYISGDPSKNKTIRVLVGTDFKRRHDMFVIHFDKWANKELKEEEKTHEKTAYAVYGLDYYRALHVEHMAPRPSLSYNEDFFTKKDENGAVITYIRCNALGSGYNPGCQHKFTFNDLEVQASYNRKYLYQWQEIEANVRAFLDRSKPVKLEKLSPECDGGNFD